MTVNTRVISILLANNDGVSIPIRDDLRIQVLPDISYLSRCAKHQFAAFIADRGILVVWDDKPENLVRRVDIIEKGLMAMIWSFDGEEDTQRRRKVVECLFTKSTPLQAKKAPLRSPAVSCSFTQSQLALRSA